MPRKRKIVIEAPFRIRIDTREQKPWDFSRITKRVDGVDVPLHIPTCVSTLHAGDYAVEEYLNRIAIERKSIQDLVGTITRGRERFERELERMQYMEFSAVVVEGEWLEVLRWCTKHTEMNPVSIDSTILAWQQRFIRTHWYFRPGRYAAMKTAWKIFDRYHRDEEAGLHGEH